MGPEPAQLPQPTDHAVTDASLMVPDAKPDPSPEPAQLPQPTDHAEMDASLMVPDVKPDPSPEPAQLRDQPLDAQLDAKDPLTENPASRNELLKLNNKR